MSESAFPGLASRPLHTRTRAHTRAQTHRPTCTRAPRIALALRGRVRGGDRRHRPLGCGGRIQRPPRAGPREGRGRGGRELCRPPPIPRAGRSQGPELGPRSLGRGREKPVPAETRGRRTDRGWPPPASAGRGWGGWSPRADAPSLPCRGQRSPVRPALPRSPGGGRWKLAFV